MGGTGTSSPFTAGFTGAQRVTDAHGRFMDATLAGRVFTFGISSTALASQNAIATGVAASSQPVIGLYNPPASNVNLVVLKAYVFQTVIANTAVAPGGFMWMYSAGNLAVSTGSTPISLKTLAAAGSAAKAFACSTALTGLTNSLAVLRPFSIAPINAAGAATAVTLVQGGGEDIVDGSIVVPPGGVIAVMNALSTTTVSVNSGIIWEELQILS